MSLQSRLDLSVWTIASAGSKIGLLSINSNRRSVLFTYEGDDQELGRFLRERSYEWWIQMLNHRGVVID